jgi:hypothetical protein
MEVVTGRPMQTESATTAICAARWIVLAVPKCRKRKRKGKNVSNNRKGRHSK